MNESLPGGVPMDDLRIGPIDFVDSRSGSPKDGLKKRKERHAEPEEEPIDQVEFSSSDETGDQPTGYLPTSRDES
jgi:hypothetical protein